VPAAGPRSNPFSAFVVPLASGRFRWLLLVFALNAIAPSITAVPDDIRTDTPEAARAFIDAQIDTWAKVVKDNDIKAD
jgi:hypothetical protein